ncbi:MAG: TIGR04219 family outer membrane beta-barrel protein [Campylobacterales bacterium]|nr:TIGR04219 family outer membrane beta-barrel protein [Campylobacterales bacterium]
MKIKSYLLIALIGINTLYADTIGGEIALGFFNHYPEGVASYTLSGNVANESVDLEKSFGWENENDMFFKAYLEHPFAFFPNIKIGYTALSHSGDSTVMDFSWGDIFSFDGTVQTNGNFKVYDITPYYEILDNYAELDLGLTFRYIDGDIGVNTLFADESTDFEEFIPMLYAKAKVTIPSTGIGLKAEANAIGSDATTFYDYEISARYTFIGGLGIEGGYKAFHLDSTELADGLMVDTDFKGPYGAITWDF